MNEQHDEARGSQNEPSRPEISGVLLVRACIGGMLMGLANLVPGISGGTMLLAAGVYPDFVESISAVTRLARRLRPWLVLAAVAIPAMLAIGVLAELVRDSVLEHRWIAYSLFIGLTLGGAPTLMRMIRPRSAGAMVSALVAFCGMIVLAIVQETGQHGAMTSEGGLMGLGLAGFAGAAAMVLPGLSGAYLLLLLGQYVAVLDAISSLADAIQSGSLGAMVEAAPPMLAIGLGVLVGVVIVSNVIRWLLENHRNATLGALLGLLLGSVAGLWPFRVAVVPQVESIVRGVRIETVAQAEDVPLKDRPMVAFTPSPGVATGAAGLVLLGFGISIGVSRIGGSGRDEGSPRD